MLGGSKIDCEKYSPICIYDIVTILCFMVALLITWILEYDIRQKSTFIFVQMGEQLFHYHLLNSVSIPNLFEVTLLSYT